MNYSNIQIDFVKRTQENLIYLYQQKIDHQKGFNEVTNLINSMMGLVCYPKEMMNKKLIHTTSVSETIQFQCEYGTIYMCLDRKGKSTQSFKEIVRHMRNSICHGNFIQGKSNERNEIEELRFQDFTYKNNRKGKKNFDMVMTVPQLQEFVKNISDNYLAAGSKVSEK